MRSLAIICTLGMTALLSADQWNNYQDSDGYNYNQGNCRQGQCGSNYRNQASYDSRYQSNGNPNMNYNMNNDGYYNNNNQNNNQMNYANSDMDLRQRIQDSLKSGWFSKGFEQITVDVNNGNVTLKGYVDNIDDRNRLEDSVRRMDGVRNLNSRVSVKGKNGPQYNKDYQADQMGMSDDVNNRYMQDYAQTEGDRIIIKKIRDGFSGWFTKGYNDYDIVIKAMNGNVTLTGTVGSASEIQKITDSIKKIDGVKNINNQLMVNDQRTAYNNRSQQQQQQQQQLSMSDDDYSVKYAQDYAQTDSDRLINKKIRDGFNGWFTKGYNNSDIVLKTVTGTVTITGTVDNSSDIPKITDAVKKIDGVKNVKNQLMVRVK